MNPLKKIRELVLLAGDRFDTMVERHRKRIFTTVVRIAAAGCLVTAAILLNKLISQIMK